MPRPVIVFIGGGTGACLRGLLLEWLSPLAAVAPVPVLLANLLGSFLLGVVYVLADEAGLLSVEARLFLAVGVLGGFTTFSTLDWGADLLLARGAVAPALLYLLASLLGGVVAVIAGLAATRALVGFRRRAPAGVRADVASIEAEVREEP